MATVYWAYDQQNNRNVALKVIQQSFAADRNLRSRFKREAQTVAQLKHPAILPIYHAAQVSGQMFLAMPLMQGGNLAERLKRGALPISEVVAVMSRLTLALDFAHSQGVIHRDIKPENIFFDKAGQAFLGDFGIAKLQEVDLALTGNAIIGTPAYMSPEQVQGDKELDGRSDLYALGIVLFEMLTGHVPYHSDTAIKTAMKHIVEPVPRVWEHNQMVPRVWQHIINRALAKKREQRYQSGQEMVADIVAAAQGKLIVPFVWKKWGKIGLLVAVIMVLLLGSIALWLRSSSPEPAVAQQTVVPVTALGQSAAIAASTVTPTHATTRVGTAEVVATEAATSVPTPLITVSAAAATVTAAPPEYLVSVNVNSAYVRRGPGVMFAELAVVLKDETFAVVAQTENGDWFLIALENGRFGWIAKTVVNPIQVDLFHTVPIAVTIPPLPSQMPATATPSGTATPILPLAFTIKIDWQPSPDQPQEAVATVRIQATGGDGTYAYYRDDIVQAGAQFTYRWRQCQSNPVSFRVDSGDGQTVTVNRVERPLCNGSSSDNPAPAATATGAYP